jgi:hypothetical protein
MWRVSCVGGPLIAIFVMVTETPRIFFLLTLKLAIDMDVMLMMPHDAMHDEASRKSRKMMIGYFENVKKSY